jgi:LuxR family maltose regulon positive regulatory protein
VDEAIGHALEADAFAEATEMMAATWMATASRGRHATVLDWIDRFPPDLAGEDPELLLIRAWMYSLAGRRPEATVAIEALERIGWPDGKQIADGSPSLEASLATMKAGFPWDDVGAGYENARRAAELQTPGSPVWPGVCWALAMGCYYRGDLDEADRRFAEAVETGPPAERWLIAVSGLAYRSFIAGDRGRPDEQRLLAEEASELAHERGVDEIRGEAHVALGAALAASGDAAAALPLLARGVGILRVSGGTIQLVNALVRQAAVLLADGRRAEAQTALAEARAVVDSCPDPGILGDHLAAVELSARVRPRRRDGDAELSERELVVLRMLGGPLSERDIGRELYLSHNTVHSHARSIYRKLGVSSRADALDRARELGLLSPR